LLNRGRLILLYRLLLHRSLLLNRLLLLYRLDLLHRLNLLILLYRGLRLNLLHRRLLLGWLNLLILLLYRLNLLILLYRLLLLYRLNLLNYRGRIPAVLGNNLRTGSRHILRGRTLDAFYHYRRGSGSQHVKLFRRRPGKVDDPGGHKGSPVIYPYGHLSVIMLIGHRQYRPEGQGRVGGGKQGGVKDFSRSRGPAVKFRPIPGGNPLLPEACPGGGLLSLSGGQRR
jgi:hypothetical protein